MKKIYSGYLQKFFYLFIITYSIFSIYENKLLAEENYNLKSLQINSSTKNDSDNTLDIPSNPFEIVETIRRANSMNDATNPSDAIDDALKSFDMIDNNKNL